MSDTLNTRYATAPQAENIIRQQLQLLQANPALAHQLPPIMLWGAPGIGKSSIIKTLCDEAGIGFVDIRLSQREPVDLRGLPVPKDDHVDWLLSGEWPRDPHSLGIILFDEITAADRSLQVAAYELILDRRLGDLYQLPDGWLVIGAGNRAADRAVSTTFSSALANRFCHLNLSADLESWCAWANSQRIHPDVVAFLRYRPECFFRYGRPGRTRLGPARAAGRGCRTLSPICKSWMQFARPLWWKAWSAQVPRLNFWPSAAGARNCPM